MHKKNLYIFVEMKDKKKVLHKFGTTLRELRTKRGLTQSELAEKIGLKMHNINAYELFISSPDFEDLRKIADFFNVKIDDII